MRRDWRVVLVTAGMALGGGRVFGADPKVPAAWPVGEVKESFISKQVTPEGRRLVGELGSGDFQMRERATRELIEKGVDAFPGLMGAIEAKGDAEIAARVAKITGVFYGDAPIPPAVAKALGSYESHREMILEQRGTFDPIEMYALNAGSIGQNEKGVQFYNMALAKETNPQLVAMLIASMVKTTPVYARLMLARGKFDEAQRLLLDASSTVREACADYAALLALRGGAEFDPEKELRAIRRRDDGAGGADQMGMLLYRAKGQEARAADYAALLAADNWYPPRPVLIEARRYEKLTGTLSSFRFDEALAKLLGGNPEPAKGLVDSSIDGLGQRQPGSQATFPLQLFLVSGRTEELIDVFRKVPDEQETAFHLLCQQLRIREALATIKDRKNIHLEIPEHLMDVGLMFEARELLWGMPAGKLGQKLLGRYCVVNDELQYAADLLRAGDVKEAGEWKERAFKMVDEDEAKRRPLELARNALLVQEQVNDDINLLRQEDAISRQLQTLQKESRTANLSYQALFPDSSAYAEVRFWENELRDDVLGTAARFERAARIAKGEITDKDAPALMEKVVGRRQGGSGLLSDLKYAVDAFHRAGRDDWVFEIVSKWEAREGDPTCWAIAGDVALEKGQPEMAFVYYRRAAVTNLTDGSLMYRMGLALKRGETAKDAGQDLIDFAPLLVLGDYAAANGLANAISRFEGTAAGDRWRDEYFNRFCRMTIYEWGDRYARASKAAEAKGDYAEALSSQKQLLFSPPTRMRAKPWDFMTIVAMYHRARALDAWSRKDWVTVVDGAWREMDNGGPDVELLEKVLPALKVADRAGAERVLGRARERLKAVVEDYPEVGKYKGELAHVEGLLK